jgi:hypothetical protein
MQGRKENKYTRYYEAAANKDLKMPKAKYKGLIS